MIHEVIKKNLLRVLKNVYGIELAEDEILLEHPNNLDWGDFATGLPLGLSKKLQQSPLDIAKKLSYELNDRQPEFEVDGQKYPIFEKIYFAAPGFVNFVLSNAWLQHVLYTIGIEGDSYGSQDKNVKNRIALEHSNVNPNKAAHIGHLRNACIGQFIERVYEKLGDEVEVQYFDNDLGIQVTTSLLATRYIKEVSPEDFDKFDHYAWEVYAQMESLIENDPKLQNERNEVAGHLEDAMHPDALEQESLAQKILLEQLLTFEKLGFDYDVIIRERDIVSLGIWEKAFELLKKNQNVYKAESGPSAGCWLVKMPGNESNEEVEGDKIIVRSNGIPTYTGKDIAYHMWKFGLLDKDFYYKKLQSRTQAKPLYITTSNQEENEPGVSFSNCEKVVNVIDVKQTYAIESVRKSLEYLGYEKEAGNMRHINYGFVYLSPETAEKLGIDISDGKSRYGMSGRKGWGIKIDDFIQMVDNRIVHEHGDSDSKDIVRNGAIKFEMLKHNTFQDLVFDLDNSLNLQGFTGPYVQYTFARTGSVMAKGGYIFNPSVQPFLPLDDLHDREKEILRLIYRYREIIKKSADDFAPNLLCTFLFELSQKYNAFYNDLPILNSDTAEIREFRLTLTNAVHIIIRNGLYLLGIESPAKM